MPNDGMRYGVGNESLIRNQSMDVLRILACMGVIFAHAGAMCFTIDIVEEGTLEWMVCFIIRKVLLFSVPVFALLTGFFLLNPEKALPLKKLYGKNTLRLLLALVFWTLFNAVTVHSGYYPFGGINTNFWYVGMCIGLYISMPVLRRIAVNDKLLKYACWVWFFIRCYYYVGYFVEVPIVFTDYVYTDFVGYCLWGYYLSRVTMSRKKTRTFYFVGVVCSLAVALVPLLTNNRVAFDYADPITAIGVFAVFLFVIKHPINCSAKAERVLTHFSKATFGIYMAHSFVVIVTFSRLHRFFPNPFVLVPVAFCVIFGMSYIITLIIKQIPLLKHWVV